MTTIELAKKVMEVRKLQVAYFASGAPRFRDKTILAQCKSEESDLDQLLNEIIFDHENATAPAIDHTIDMFIDEHLDSDPYNL